MSAAAPASPSLAADPAPTRPRYVVVGAGAVGTVLADALRRSGREALLVARGAQLTALQQGALRLVRPEGEHPVAVPFASGPEQVELTARDVLVLAVKTQDAESALAAWAWRPVRLPDGGTAPAAAALPVVTLQNGLETERAALRRFARVLGAVVWTPAQYVSPGLVVNPAAPTPAVLWLGRYPAAGARPDAALPPLVADLRAAGFQAREVDDVRAWKAWKLAGNTVNALDALYRRSPLRDRVAARLAEEARAVFAAAGLPVADPDRDGPLDTSGFTFHEIPGHPRGRTSTWQSLVRSGSLEADFLAGEVVLQARLAGVAAPLNEAVLARLRRAEREGARSGVLGDADLAATVPGERPPTLLDAHRLRAELAGEQPPLLLDVRWALGDPHGRDHYLAGHLPGARYVDLDAELAAPPAPLAGRHPLPSAAALQRSARAWGLTAGRPVVVYDDNGGLSAARAWWLLRWAGVADVRLLDGGLAGWRADGGPLSTGEEPDPAPGDVVLSGGQLPVLDADAAAALPGAGGVLLDARAGERYRGETEPVDSRAGHIPGALSAPTGDNLGPDGRFLLEPEQLRKRFAALGVPQAADGGAGGGEVTVGVYCGSGVTAAHQIAALAVAGIDAALYPGSWSAWSADPARPVATGPEPGPTGRANPDPNPVQEAHRDDQ